MDFMDGVCLDDLLKKPTESDRDPLILDPDIDPEEARPHLQPDCKLCAPALAAEISPHWRDF